MKSVSNFYIDSCREYPNALVFNSIFCLSSLLELRFAKALKPHGLTPIKFNALILIKHYKDKKGLTQQEIGSNMILSPSNITRMLNGLNKEGLIERVSNPQDRRSNLITITDQGCALLAHVFEDYRKVVRSSVMVSSEEDVNQMADLLVRFFMKLEKAT